MTEFPREPGHETFVISPKFTSCTKTEPNNIYHGLLSLLGHSVSAVNCYSLGNRKHDLSMEAVAKFSFIASQVDELSFEKGTVLNVSYRRFPLLLALRCCTERNSFSGFRQR